MKWLRGLRVKRLKGRAASTKSPEWKRALCFLAVSVAAFVALAALPYAGEVVRIGDQLYTLMGYQDLKELEARIHAARLDCEIVKAQTNANVKTAFELEREIMKARRRVALSTTNQITIVEGN